MYKEYYTNKLPMHLQHLVPTEPLGIEKTTKKTTSLSALNPR